MGGIASRRCEVCRKLVMVSDRGDVETVGAAKPVSTQDDIDRAICVCGTLVSWPRRLLDARPSGAAVPTGILALAHPRNLGICARDGHDPMNLLPDPVDGGRVTTVNRVCKRCGGVYMMETLV